MLAIEHSPAQREHGCALQLQHYYWNIQAHHTCTAKQSESVRTVLLIAIRADNAACQAAESPAGGVAAAPQRAGGPAAIDGSGSGGGGGSGGGIDLYFLPAELWHYILRMNRKSELEPPINRCT